MAASSRCPVCGLALPFGVAVGQCPICLLGLGLPGEEGGSPLPSDEATSEGLRSIGDYELLEEIGRGGMGVVFKARQRSLDRLVALKLLPAGTLAKPESVRRFQAEASAAAALQHPNIVAIHEIGVRDDEHFIAMDLVDGPPLSRIVANGPLPPRRAAAYMKAIAEAVHYAHERGILHRDLKPSNVLLGADDQPRVTDFGLAKRFEPVAADVRRLTAKSETDQSLLTSAATMEMTLSGQLLGSPNYMPPEQAAAPRGKVSRRSDVYGLGATLYHLLTGRAPFQASTITEVLQQVANADPLAPRLLNPVIPRDLETLCLKCLEKEPARRYQTAQALAEDLDRFLRNEPIQARPVGRLEKAWRWCRRKPAIATAYSLVILLVLLILIASPIAIYRINHERQRAEKGESAARASELATRQKAYASDMNLAQQALAQNNLGRAQELLNRHRPAANQLRSSRREEAHFQLGTRNSELGTSQSLLTSAATADLSGWEWRYLWRQCQGEERFILGEHTNGATAVGLLADGKMVFSAGRDKLVRLWDLESRRQIGLLPHAEEVIGAAASPDGRWLATATRKYGEVQPVLLWDLATQKIAAPLTTNFWLRPGSITFSPDSKWLAFATVFGGLRLWDVDARSEVTNLPASNPLGAPLGLAFSPDSRTLAYNENEDGAIPLWDIASRSVIGRLTGRQSAVTALAFSPTGQTLASGSQDRTARLWNVAERREGFAFTNHSGGLTTLAFSPDGRTLAMGGAGGAGRVIRLVEVKTGSHKAELQGHLKDISSLAFTRDGHTLLSTSGDDTVRVWDPVPRAREKSAHLFARNSISTAWRTYGPALCLSPNGRHLLTVYANQTFSVWDTLRLAEGARHPLPFTNTTSASVAPDGRLAAFGSQSGEVMLWDAETSQARSFAWPGTNYIHRLVFSLDGRHLAAADDAWTLSQMGVPDDTRRTVHVWDVGARKHTHFFSTAEGGLPASLTFSADARALMAGFARGWVKLWPLDGSGEAATFLGHSAVVRGLAMLTNGPTLISAGPDIRFWDVRTRHENALQLNPRAGGYDCLALSPDGRRFAAGASDGRITIWDVASHQEVATLEGHEESVRQLAFTPDGDHLVSASKDQLRVWRALSWAEIDAAEKRRK